MTKWPKVFRVRSRPSRPRVQTRPWSWLRMKKSQSSVHPWWTSGMTTWTTATWAYSSRCRATTRRCSRTYCWCSVSSAPKTRHSKRSSKTSMRTTKTSTAQSGRMSAQFHLRLTKSLTKTPGCSGGTELQRIVDSGTLPGTACQGQTTNHARFGTGNSDRRATHSTRKCLK